MGGDFADSCEEAYKAVFSDSDPTTWCWLGYEGNKLAVAGKGDGDLQEMLSKVDDNIILYGLLRLNKTDDGGDSKRVKFVYLTWVGENAPAMKKGKVNMHKGACGQLFKGYHIEKQIFAKEELQNLEADIDDSLRRAGGANYDLGNIRTGVQAGKSTDLKNASKEFFSQKEKETTIAGIVYDKGPLSKELTSCDLGGRAMTVGASVAKKNTVGYDSTVQA